MFVVWFLYSKHIPPNKFTTNYHTCTVMTAVTVHVKKGQIFMTKNHNSHPSTSRTHNKAAWTEEIIEGHWSKHNEITDFVTRRKMKWMFMNVCEHKSPISTASEFLNSCQVGASASTGRRLHWNVMKIVWNKWSTYIFDFRFEPFQSQSTWALQNFP